MEIRRLASPPMSAAARKKQPDPLAQVDRLIDDIRSGEIHYAPEIAAKIRPRELTANNWPCQKYVLHAGPLPTEIVPKGEKSRYRNELTEKSNLTESETQKDLNERVDSIHERSGELFTQQGESLLILLEGDNADGKDGMLKHVFALNPQTTSGVHSFKGASPEEKQHDPNWRIMQHLPGPGQIGFHNRSAYGDVVFAARTPEEKAHRAAAIQEMEYGLTMGLPMTPEGHIALPDQAGQVDPSAVQRYPMRIMKVLLDISAPEQAARFAERLLNDDKLYKSSLDDVQAHPRHGEVQANFAQAMGMGNTDFSPTYHIPNDNKLTGWRKLAEITDKVLEDMDPQPPAYDGELSQSERQALAATLLAEAKAARRGA